MATLPPLAQGQGRDERDVASMVHGFLAETDRLLPSAWLKGAGFVGVRGSSYSAPSLTESHAGTTLYEDDELVAGIVHCAVPYEPLVLRSYQAKWGIGNPGLQIGPCSTHMVILSARHGPGPSPKARLVRRRNARIREIIAVVMGRGAALEHVGSWEWWLEGGTRSFVQLAHRIPGTPELRGAALRATRREEITRLVGLLRKLPPGRERTIETALRWYGQAIEEGRPEDSFLKLWIAIEALSMPDSTNVRSAIRMLAASYGFREEEARDFFQLGRIQGLRSRILHEGALVEVSPRFIDLVCALFRDLLFAELGIPCEQAFATALGGNEDEFRLQLEGGVHRGA